MKLLKMTAEKTIDFGNHMFSSGQSNLSQMINPKSIKPMQVSGKPCLAPDATHIHCTNDNDCPNNCFCEPLGNQCYHY